MGVDKMGTTVAEQSLSELIKTVSVGEDGDQAYARLYGKQVKPCDFRRWYTQVKQTGTSAEIDADTVENIATYIAEDLRVDEAFKDFCPDYVGPGEFSVAYTKEVAAQKAAAGKVPVADVEPPSKPVAKKKAAVVPVVTPPVEAVVPADVPVDSQTAV